MKQLYETVVAALLHDIGKFEQRGRPGKTPHPQLGQEFVQQHLSGQVREADLAASRVDSLVGCHHVEQSLVSLADQIAAGERDPILLDSEEQDASSTPLRSIFSRIQLDPQMTVRTTWHKLEPLAFDETLFPQAEKPQLDYGRHWTRFVEDVASLRGSDPEVLVCGLLFLLGRYTWCVPSATYGSQPDISLYDHLRLTAAITACLELYQQQRGCRPDLTTPAMHLVAGDVSGIQSYIFGISNVGSGGPAALLRARSFMVTQWSRQAALQVLGCFALPATNLLVLGGGKFYLLVPNLPASEENLSQQQAHLDRQSLESYRGELSIRLAWVPLSGADLQDFGRKQSELNRQLQQAKRRPLAGALQTAGRWEAQRFVGRPFGPAQSLCPACSRNPVEVAQELQEQEAWLCRQCQQQIELGKKLRGVTKWGLQGEGLLADYEQIMGTDAGADADLSKPVLLAPTANYVPAAEGGDGVMPFHHDGEPSHGIAGKSRGQVALGYLKADVDNLGRLFSEGLSRPDCVASGGGGRQRRITLSSVMALSRALEWFFGGYVPQLLQRGAEAARGPDDPQDFSFTYTVFAGGDDLLLVGPWDRMLHLAERLTADFAHYTGDNPDVHWSAGYVRAGPRLPVTHAVEAADAELDRAKEVACPSRKDHGRNQIAALGSLLEWKDLPDLLQRAQWWAAWIEQGRLSAQFVRTVLECARLWQRWVSTRHVESLGWVPLLTYQLRRLLSEDHPAWAELVQIKEDGLNDRRTPLLAGLSMLSQYALLANRGE